MYDFVVEYLVDVFRLVESFLELASSPLWICFLLYQASAELFKFCYCHSLFEYGCLLDQLYALFYSLLFLFPHLVFVKSSNSYQGKRVANQLSLDLFIEHTRAAQRRQTVDLEHPWLHVLVPDDVEAVDFKATPLPIAYFVEFPHQLGFDRDQCLGDDVVAAREDVILGFEYLLEVALEELQTPLGGGFLLRVLFVIFAGRYLIIGLLPII